MGRSVDAYIYYGILINERDIPDTAYEAHGITPGMGPEYLIEALNLPIEEGSYGCEFEGTVIYTQKIWAWGGKAKSFAPSDLQVGPKDAKYLRAFCEATGIEYVPPGWFLCPSYS